MGRQRSYKLHDSFCKSPYEQAIDEAISASKASRAEKPAPKPKKKPFVPADPRCKKCYYWQNLSGYNQFTFACHYALENGKLRTRISETECGSFLDRSTAPERKTTFASVPMSQWGCGGLGIIRKGER